MLPLYTHNHLVYTLSYYQPTIGITQTYINLKHTYLLTNFAFFCTDRRFKVTADMTVTLIQWQPLVAWKQPRLSGLHISDMNIFQ